MSARNTRRWTALLGVVVACASTSSFALVVPYYGSQGPKSNFLVPNPPPLSSAVSAAVAGFTNSINVLGRNEFETGATTFSYTNGVTTGSATLFSGSPTVIDGDTRTSAQLGQGRYNMTAGTINPNTGGLGFGHWLEATGDFTLRFSSAISAFGFYGTDFGDFDGSASIDFLSGSTLVYSSAISAPGSNGNLLFFGAVSSSAFDSVVFHITQLAGQPTIDVLGFDSFVVGTARLGVPEPGSLALAGLALACLGATAHRARRTRHATPL